MGKVKAIVSIDERRRKYIPIIKHDALVNARRRDLTGGDERSDLELATEDPCSAKAN